MIKNKQTNKHFISAKSSQILRKTVGIPRWFKLKTDKQTNKQTKTFGSKISQPNQVQSYRNIQEIFLWIFQYAFWNKEKTNKQTRKHINNFIYQNISAKLSQVCTNLSVKLPVLKLLGLIKATGQGARRVPLGDWRPQALCWS